MAQRYGKQDVLDTVERLKNCGRFGPDDQIGALNFVSPDASSMRRAWFGAARCSRSGSRSTRRAAGRSLKRPLESDPHHARDRHRCRRRQA
jgi:hypothetical protein